MTALLKGIITTLCSLWIGTGYPAFVVAHTGASLTSGWSFNIWGGLGNIVFWTLVWWLIEYRLDK